MKTGEQIELPNHLNNKIMNATATREFCTICCRYSSLSFWVPDEIYEACIDTKKHQHVCLPCFIAKADERLIEWEKDIIIFPCSFATQRKIQSGETIDTVTLECVEWDEKKCAGIFSEKGEPKNNQNMDEIPPRRIRIDLFTPAELAIYNAQQEVEKAGADVRLTKASTLLSQAREAVADFVDEKQSLERSTEGHIKTKQP